LYRCIQLRWYPHSLHMLFLIVLLVPTITTLNVRPAVAVSASIDHVDLSSSVVRQNEAFWVTPGGTYDTDAAMNLNVNIIQQGGPQVGNCPDNIAAPNPPGVEVHAHWSCTAALLALMNPPFDAQGKYVWPLEADLVGYNSFPFTVMIIKTDADAYVHVNPHAQDKATGEPVTDVYVGSNNQVLLDVEYSVPAASSLKIRFQNSLGVIDPAYPVGGDGWSEDTRQLLPPPWSGTVKLIVEAPAPLSPAAEWVWKVEATVTPQVGPEQKDTSSLTLHVLPRSDRWADVKDVSYAQCALPGSDFPVNVNGAYVFPGDTSGDLQVEIVQQGFPISHGDKQTIPNAKGTGTFSQAFTITAPPAQGLLSLEARLWMSGNPDPVAKYPFSPTVSQPCDNLNAKIIDVKVNGAAPPQDVTYGNPLQVTLHLSWHVPLPPPSSHLLMTIYDWETGGVPIADLTYEDPGLWCVGTCPDTFTLQIPASDVPNRNGPWKLRATVEYRPPGGNWQSTPNDYQKFFEVNVVGASGVPAGGTSDWAVTGISTSPVDPFLGIDVTFVARIEVTTNDPLPQTVTVACSVDAVQLFKAPVTYPGGAFLAVPAQPWTPILGQHTVKCEVDPEKAYNDANRANNVMEVPFTVSETPPQPPLPPGGQGQPPPPPPPLPGQEFDFYVTAVPTEQTVMSPVTYKVTVDVTSGTPQPVQLDLTGAPAGLSYIFSPPSGTPSYNSTLTITTTSNLPAGTYPLTIKASGAGKDRYKLLSLIVPKGPDYTLAISPDPVHVNPGEKAEFKVTASSDSGYSQFVNLRVLSVLEGAVIKLDPSASVPTFESTLTVELGKDVKPGSYRITVIGSGPEEKRVSATLIVEGQVENPGSRQATVNYLAAGILALIVAIVIAGGFLAVRRSRTKRKGEKKEVVKPPTKRKGAEPSKTRLRFGTDEEEP